MIAPSASATREPAADAANSCVRASTSTGGSVAIPSRSSPTAARSSPSPARLRDAPAEPRTRAPRNPRTGRSRPPCNASSDLLDHVTMFALASRLPSPAPLAAAGVTPDVDWHCVDPLSAGLAGAGRLACGRGRRTSRRFVTSSRPAIGTCASWKEDLQRRCHFSSPRRRTPRWAMSPDVSISTRSSVRGAGSRGGRRPCRGGRACPGW
jgi:hypothetical protein